YFTVLEYYLLTFFSRFFFFFFQADDGIRDFHVTGVQTCALPISPPPTATGTAGVPASTASRPPPPRRANNTPPRRRSRTAPCREIGRASCRDKAKNRALEISFHNTKETII